MKPTNEQIRQQLKIELAELDDTCAFTHSESLEYCYFKRLELENSIAALDANDRSHGLDYLVWTPTSQEQPSYKPDDSVVQ